MHNITVDKGYDVLSPNYPLHYPPNQHYTWRLYSSADTSFVITFLSFVTHNENDFLTVGKGYEVEADNLMYTFSSWIQSGFVGVFEASAMWMEFQTDTVGSAPGFKLRIDRIGEKGELHDM